MLERHVRIRVKKPFFWWMGNLPGHLPTERWHADRGARLYLAAMQHVLVLAPSEHASFSNEARAATLAWFQRTRGLL